MESSFQGLVRRIVRRFAPGATNDNLGALNRNRVALLTALSNAANKGIGMTIILAGIAWTLPYLGEVMTGAWLTIVSLLTVLVFLDFGLGNAMTNHTSSALVRDPTELSTEVSVGLILLAILSMLVASLAYLALEFAPWQLLFKLPADQNVDGHLEVEFALQVFVALFGAQILANGLIKTVVGLQKAHVAYGLQALLGIVGLVALYVLTENQLGMPYLLVCLMAPQLVTGVLLYIWLRRRGVLNFKLGIVSFSTRWKRFASLGGYFFVMQLCATLGWGADALIISSTLGVVAVAPFVLCQRMFQFASQPVAILAAPLWPAYANAQAMGDIPYIRSLLSKSMRTAALLGGGLILLIAFLSPVFIEFLVKDDVPVSQTLVWLYGLWVLIEILGSTFSMFLNGVGIVRLQAILASIYVLISFPLKILAINWWGLHGMVLTGIMTYTLVMLIPYILLIKRSEKYEILRLVRAAN